MIDQAIRLNPLNIEALRVRYEEADLPGCRIIKRPQGA